MFWPSHNLHSNASPQPDEVPLPHADLSIDQALLAEHIEACSTEARNMRSKPLPLQHPEIQLLRNLFLAEVEGSDIDLTLQPELRLAAAPIFEARSYISPADVPTFTVLMQLRNADGRSLLFSYEGLEALPVGSAYIRLTSDQREGREDDFNYQTLLSPDAFLYVVETFEQRHEQALADDRICPYLFDELCWALGRYLRVEDGLERSDLLEIAPVWNSRPASTAVSTCPPKLSVPRDGQFSLSDFARSTAVCRGPYEVATRYGEVVFHIKHSNHSVPRFLLEFEFFT